MEAAGQKALAKARKLAKFLCPSVFSSFQQGGRDVDLCRLFAAVAALNQEGYQPFVATLTPVADPEVAAGISVDPLIEKVEAHERCYQEEASRWLIAAHFLEGLLAFKTDNEGFFAGGPLTTGQAIEGVAIINKWWPWIEVLEDARKKNIQYLDWKALGADELWL